MRQVSSFFQQESSIPLYHYTGIGSLLGIASTESLWASSISYLNDSSEIIHACETVENVLKARLIFGVQDEENKFLAQFQSWTNFCKNTAHMMFIFSLSEVPSLLSQWRSYTPHGRGVSLGFSPEKVNLIIQSSGFKLARCVYDRDEQELVINSLIEKLLVSFRQELPTIDVSRAHPDQCYHNFIQQYANEIFQVLAIIKHGAFQEEREWRLISPHYPKYTDPKIKFREGASMLVPYMELFLESSKPYFCGVILGPSSHQNLSMSGLSMFLSNKGLCTQVSNCVIPYREW
jgi:hypothetical protein